MIAVNTANPKCIAQQLYMTVSNQRLLLINSFKFLSYPLFFARNKFIYLFLRDERIGTDENITVWIDSEIDVFTCL